MSLKKAAIILLSTDRKDGKTEGENGNYYRSHIILHYKKTSKKLRTLLALAIYQPRNIESNEKQTAGQWECFTNFLM